MNNFLTQNTSNEIPSNSIPKHLEQLSTTVFQSLFPPISPQNTPLSSIRRVLLINRETESSGSSKADSVNGIYRLSIRHYAIVTRSTSVPRPLRRLEQATSSSGSKFRQRGPPNLGKLEDVADYLLDPEAGNYTSGSESELETDAEVEVLQEGARKVIGRRKEKTVATGDSANGVAQGTGGEGEVGQQRKGRGVRTVRGSHRVEKRAVKLVELGPRLTLRLIKVEEGLSSGKVMWHESVKKTKEEEREMDKVWEERNREKERRKKEQRENVERKKREKAEKSGTGEGEEGEEGENGGDLDEEEIEDWDMDDDEWFDNGVEEDDADSGERISQGQGQHDDVQMEEDQ